MISQGADNSHTASLAHWRSIALLILMLALAAPSEAASRTRGQKGATAQAASLVAVRLIPSEAVLRGRNASQQFLVIGKFTDGRERDLTGRTEFSLSADETARLGDAGRVFAKSDGEIELTASVDGNTAKAVIRIEGSQQDRPFSFARDIGGILTRRGCNSSGCHGGVKGQAGFKLSSNALHAREDYKWIVEGGLFQVLTSKSGGPKTPRVNVDKPEASLLLQKATMAVAHGGGPRFDTASGDYQTILDWIKNGAPYGDEGGDDGSGKLPKLTDLKVVPASSVLRPGEEQRLLVTAHFSDGHTEDFTHQVLYETSDSEVASVGPSGLIEARKPGETAVLIKAAGRSARTGVGVIAEPRPDYPGVPRNNFIDEKVFAKLRKFNIVPSELSSDSEFLRRVCLDLTGRLPPRKRVKEFLASRDPRKREKLIDTLLASPEYIDYWTFRFADLFRVAVFPVGINTKWSQAYWEWIRDAIARDRPYSEVASERIAAQGYSAPSRHYLPYLVLPPAHDMMGEEVRVFMGRRLDCAQCHDHPYENWSQDQFWGLSAFFGPMFKLGGNPASVIFDHPGGKEVAPDVASPRELRVIHPRTHQEVQPTLLDGTVVPYTEHTFPRRELAKWMTSHPYFAEAAVNRMWSLFFGRGFVNPVDDFRSTNPPSHPELLRLLATDFADHGYRLKRLIRLIVNSRTYQLSSATNDTNQADRMNYSHTLPRPLDAEILLDAITDVTGVPETFSLSLPGGAARKGGKAPRGTRAVELKETDIYYSRFLDLYGRPNRLSVPERDATPKLSQALHMLAGSTYNDKLWAEGGRVYDLYHRNTSDAKIIKELYLTALSRPPSKQEVRDLKALIAATPTRQRALQDLQWAILSSREFAENH